jgi:tetratricopeptide (TPR) repeat protein
MSEPERQVMSLLGEAVEHSSPEERAAFLDRACAGDAGRRARVEELLRAHEAAGNFMQGNRPPAEPVATVDEPIRERPGTLIGPYKLLEQIGEGGFGVVFMAEQQHPVRRKVALKLLKPGMDTRQVVARFEAERQALAIMDHPNIAKVHDSGQTASGRPYFVMELVKGTPITEFCDQNCLTPRQRLGLFADVCQAVQHAHQKGIVHRDLKPSNVLVSRHDTMPAVRVIDFGVAKALGQELTDKTLFTGVAQMIGTPLYMSPEQAGMSDLDIDTRSDIYSLGVLLYELLAGTTPFDQERLRTIGYDEMRRIIREEEPPRPSTRLSTLGPAAATVASNRQSDPKKLGQLMRGELDWIVMKALEKDRNRRYETASAFAADVQRYLADEAVLACPPSAWYRFRTFARRKKTALAMAAGALLALAGIAGTVGWAVRDKGAREDGIERERLVREEALDQAVASSLEETGPLIEDGKWPEALAAVGRADKLLTAAGRTERPRRLVELRNDLTMAERLERIYRGPGRGLTVQVMPSGSGTEDASRVQPGSFEAEFFSGRQQDAEFARAFRDFGIDIDTLDPVEAAAQITHRTIRSALAKALDAWAPLRKRARGDKDAGWTKLVEIARRADPDPWRNRCREAMLRHDRPALEQLADAVPIRQLPPASLYLLGHTLKEVGALDKALGLLRRAQHEYPGDLWISDALADFSANACQPPRWDDALRFYTAVLALRPGLAPIHRAVADALKAKGALPEALVEYSRAIELEPNNGWLWLHRGGAYRELHQYDRAFADLSKAIELEPNDGSLWYQRGEAYRELRQYDRALADFSKAIELVPNNGWFRLQRAVAYRELGQDDRALADLSKAIELEPNNGWRWYHRGGLYRELRQFDRALADFSKAIELVPDSSLPLASRGLTYMELGAFDKALADLNKAIEKEPRKRDAWTLRAQTYELLGQKDKALADWSKATEWEPGKAWDWNCRGRAYMKLHQYHKALADFSKAIELESNNGWRWIDRASAYNELHQYDKALADLTKAIELDPKVGREAIRLKDEFARAHNNFGAALYRKGQLDEAITEFREALRLKKDFADAHDNLGVALAGKGRLDEGIAEFREAIRLKKGDATAHSNLGNALRMNGRLDEAIAECREAVRLKKDDPAAHINLGAALADNTRLDEAIAEYRQAIALDPKNAMAHSNLGNALAGKARLDEAIAEYRQAIALDPKNAVAHSNLGAALRKNGRLDEAIAECREAIALDPKFALAHNNLCAALFEMGRLAEAIPELRAAIRLKPDDLALYGSLVSLLATAADPKLRDGAEAQRLARKMVERASADAVSWQALGWALYRTGAWKESVAAFHKSMDLQKDPRGGDSGQWFGLAADHGRMGNEAEARKWYGRAARWMDKNAPKDKELLRYRAEAAQVLGVKR